MAVEQAAVANLGQLALSGASIAFLLEQASAIVTSILDVERCDEEPCDEEPFGVLRVRPHEGQTFSTSDVDFLRSIAGIVGQAIGRSRADDEVRRRSIRQSAIAELCRVTLTRVDDAALDRACQLLATGLGVETFVVDAKLIRDGPETAGIAAAAGMGNGLVVPVASATRLWGVLSIQPRGHDRFSEADLEYAQSVADLLSRALEREHAREGLEAVSRSLQLVLESTVEAIFTIDRQGLCTMSNAASARLTGRSREELLGANLHELLHSRRADGSPRPTEDCPVHAVLRDRSPRMVVDDVFWRGDGTTVPVEYSAAPIVDGDEVVGAVVCVTDTTERRRLELKLEQASRLTSLGRLAASMAHEFNNVLMGILPYLEVARRKPERVQTALEQIAGAVERGRGITADILHYTRPMELVHAAFDVAPWLAAVAAEARSMLGVAYTVDVVVANPRLRVDADRHQLHQTLMNLVLNARDAMSDGGVITLAARREPAGTRFPFGVVEQPERFIHFTIADTGCGMSAETLRHLFEPLFTTKKSGHGLGLAFSWQTVARHSGEIFVESSVGEGTTFHVFIPAAEPGGELPLDHGGGAPVGSRRSARRLLLVEDDDTVAGGLMALLQIETFEVERVTTGVDAIASVRRAQPDVVLLDLGLPDMTGIDVWKQLPPIPVIFSTGSEMASIDLPAAPNIASLRKPYELETLLAAIEQVCGA